MGRNLLSGVPWGPTGKVLGEELNRNRYSCNTRLIRGLSLEWKNVSKIDRKKGRYQIAVIAFRPAATAEVSFLLAAIH